MTLERLAKLRSDGRGVVDIYKQTTYSAIGSLLTQLTTPDAVHWLYGDHRPPLPSARLEYESVAIRMTGGFDD